MLQIWSSNISSQKVRLKIIEKWGTQLVKLVNSCIDMTTNKKLPGLVGPVSSGSPPGSYRRGSPPLANRRAAQLSRPRLANILFSAFSLFHVLLPPINIRLDGREQKILPT